MCTILKSELYTIKQQTFGVSKEPNPFSSSKCIRSFIYEWGISVVFLFPYRHALNAFLWIVWMCQARREKKNKNVQREENEGWIEVECYKMHQNNHFLKCFPKWLTTIWLIYCIEWSRKGFPTTSIIINFREPEKCNFS